MSIEVRRAGGDDAAELTRLRVVMFTDMGADVALMDEAWRAKMRSHLVARLAERDRFAAFVVDAPGAGGLAASAVGWLNRYLPSGPNPSGDVGYIASMSTDVDFRGRGYARATLTALVDWMRSLRVHHVDLHATAPGERLYRSLGFAPPRDPALTLRLR